MSRKIAFFDFDGTITSRDTLLEFIRFAKGDLAFIAGFLLYSPFIVAFKLGIITNQQAKEKVLAHFFSDTTIDEFNQLCREFARKAIPGLVRQKAMSEIAKLKAEGAEIVVVSASAENWVGEWSRSQDLGYLATRMECRDGKLSGKIVGRNCYGDEKVQRIRSAYDLGSFDKIYCYGDSAGDYEMLALAHIKFYRPFR